MVNAFYEAQKLQDFRLQYARTHWTRKHFKIPGRKLESWFLKTLINVAYGQPKRIGKDSTEVGMPSNDLVEIAFGRRDFSDPTGLYTIAMVNDSTPNDGTFKIVTLVNKSDYINGAIFHFGELKNLLYLDDDARPAPENFLVHKYPEILESKFMYRLNSAKFLVHGRVSHSVDFDWRTPARAEAVTA